MRGITMTGKEVKALRRAYGLTQEQLSNFSGVALGDIKILETTKRPLVSINTKIHKKLTKFFERI